MFRIQCNVLCAQSTTVQHALVSVQNWVHCICVKFSIQTEFQCIALHCVLHCEMKQLVPHQDLMHQFILVLMQSSHPFLSPICQSQPPHYPRQRSPSLQKHFTSIFRGAVRLTERPVRVRLWRGSQRERDWSWQKHPSVSDTASTTG